MICKRTLVLHCELGMELQSCGQRKYTVLMAHSLLIISEGLSPSTPVYARTGEKMLTELSAICCKLIAAFMSRSWCVCDTVDKSRPKRVDNSPCLYRLLKPLVCHNAFNSQLIRVFHYVLWFMVEHNHDAWDHASGTSNFLPSFQCLQ